MKTVYAGPTFWPLDQSTEVMKAYREFILGAPEHVNGFFAFLTIPPSPMFPEHLHLKKVCGVMWVCTGPARPCGGRDEARCARSASRCWITRPRCPYPL